MTEQATVPQHAFTGHDELALLRRLRSGEDAAFGELFELHAAAVRRLALGLAADRSEAEDITAETFFRVLQALRRGAGPRDHIRAYLLTVARRVSWEWHGARRDVPVTDDELTNRAGADADTHARTDERTLITTAFTSLPERWRTVLWQTEVEGEQPAVVAPHFGLSANATAALARRARLGLRAAYLQAHLAVDRTADVGCRAVTEKLGGYTAGSVTGSEARKIRKHLMGCASCRSMHAELRDVCSSLRAHAGVLVLLVPASGLVLGTAGSAGSSGAGVGFAAAVKGFLVGSKIQVGIALASTAAVGALGVAGGPVLFDPRGPHQLAQPDQGVQLLQIAPPVPGPGQNQKPVPPPAPRPGGAAVIDFVAPAGAGPAPGREHDHPATPPGEHRQLPSEVVVGTGPQLPGVQKPGTPPSSPPASTRTGTPRIDPGTGDPSPSSDITTPRITTDPSWTPEDPVEPTTPRKTAHPRPRQTSSPAGGTDGGPPRSGARTDDSTVGGCTGTSASPESSGSSG
ncbi:sigma factor [Amycolatopsis sp. CA-230715]|uniref:sigma factor n=1 Tax=Amycolatopsis sp. CA-230715 TaxID=2745196 RepID=UPI001C013DD3|nr:sigma-70 family RNA polymerase sigma factor [Amycolatopsis sp. CA-230715]QWF80298.1 hypothetical protein HUW46_03717 [Amycolatopsis sp. CA-230715]